MSSASSSVRRNQVTLVSLSAELEGGQAARVDDDNDGGNDGKSDVFDEDEWRASDGEENDRGDEDDEPAGLQEKINVSSAAQYSNRFALDSDTHTNTHTDIPFIYIYVN